MKLLLLVAGMMSVLALEAPAQVSAERLLAAGAEPHNWLTYSGSFTGHRHSTLSQVTPENIRNLELKWVFQSRAPADPAEKFEATPLVVDGILYTVLPPNYVVALDAKTGRMFWSYTPRLSPRTQLCCGQINRGLAILDDTLFLATLDARLIAIDAKAGKPIWDVAVADPAQGYSFTMAPLVVKDQVIIGPAGGEYGIRGFLAAFGARDGKERWRFHTIPAPGEPGHETWPATDAWKHGGAPVWVTGSYDPAADLIYWGTGNPGPDWMGSMRAGDNLYSSSVVALDADTGKLRWHYQFTPHDEFDFDAAQIPVLVDLPWNHEPRKLMLWANRNGFWYVLDRLTGEFLRGAPFTKATWAEGFDAKGRPNRVLSPTPEGTLIYPCTHGATSWYSPSFSPRTGLFYIPSWMDTHAVYRTGKGEFQAGAQYVGPPPSMSFPGIKMPLGSVHQRPRDEGWGAIQAFDPISGERRWIYESVDFLDSGILTTSSDLLFSGGRDGYFFALEARTGELLWKINLGAQVSSGPIAYAVDGQQYVAVAAGSGLFVYGLRQ